MSENGKAAYELSNVMEMIVKDKVRSIWKEDKKHCHCEKCFNDICAIVLNKTAPAYVNTLKGSLLAQIPELNVERQMAMTVDIMRAMKLVGENPKHDA